MTDKEQKKWHEQKWGTNEEPEETPTERPHCDDDSIKNQDKEQLIIDGVDVNECKGYYFSPTGYHSCSSISQINELGYEQDTLCEQNPNCYFKQLARKTQECEELKEKLNTVQFNFEQKCNVLKDIGVVQDNNGGYQIPSFIRHRKALKEVKEIVKDWYKNEWSCYMCRKNMDKKLKEILDIINKTKDGKNEQL